MRELKMRPDGWPCLIEECPPGFFVYEDQLCFKNEYMDQPFNSAGEYFQPKKVEVQPVSAWWENIEL